jgi:hypothetical protein
MDKSIEAVNEHEKGMFFEFVDIVGLPLLSMLLRKLFHPVVVIS